MVLYVSNGSQICFVFSFQILKFLYFESLLVHLLFFKSAFLAHSTIDFTWRIVSFRSLSWSDASWPGTYIIDSGNFVSLEGINCPLCLILSGGNNPSQRLFYCVVLHWSHLKSEKAHKGRRWAVARTFCDNCAGFGSKLKRIYLGLSKSTTPWTNSYMLSKMELDEPAWTRPVIFVLMPVRSVL